MVAREQIVAFDARRVDRAAIALWTADRRAVYLLKTEVNQPLSVDTLVWPSVWPADLSERAMIADSRRGIEGCAANLQTLDHGLATMTVPKPYWVVAITVVSANVSAPFVRATEPSQVTATWQPLGYDVADGSLLSGLSNCGYLPAEVQRLRDAWAPHLNDVGLFSEPGTATRFGEVAKGRDKDTAAYYVFGIYVVSKHRRISP